MARAQLYKGDLQMVDNQKLYCIGRHDVDITDIVNLRIDATRAKCLELGVKGSQLSKDLYGGYFNGYISCFGFPHMDALWNVRHMGAEFIRKHFCKDDLKNSTIVCTFEAPYRAVNSENKFRSTLPSTVYDTTKTRGQLHRMIFNLSHSASAPVKVNFWNCSGKQLIDNTTIPSELQSGSFIHFDPHQLSAQIVSPMSAKGTGSPLLLLEVSYYVLPYGYSLVSKELAKRVNIADKKRASNDDIFRLQVKSANTQTAKRYQDYILSRECTKVKPIQAEQEALWASRSGHITWYCEDRIITRLIEGCEGAFEAKRKR